MKKPKPPLYVGAVTIGQAVDSSATTIGLSMLAYITSFNFLKKSIASIFSFPPY